MNIPDHLSWDDVRLVKAVSDALGIPGAAAALRLDQSTVFRRLGAIEKTLGTPLFERRRSHYAPTPTGEELIRIARDMEKEIEGFARKVVGRAISPAGEIRVATADSLLIHLLTPLLARFQNACPDIRIDVVVGNASLNLSKRDADVAIRAGNTPPDTLVGRRVGKIAWALYGRAVDFPDIASFPPSMDALKHRPWVSLNDDMETMAVVQSTKAIAPPPLLRFRSNTVLGLAQAIAAGMGIGFAPCFICDNQPGVIRLAPPDARFSADLWLLTHADLRQSPRIRAFLDFMAVELAAAKQMLAGSLHAGGDPEIVKT